MDVSLCGGGDQIVILSRFKLESSGSGAEGSECDGEVHELLRFVANCHNFWPWISHSAIVKLFFRNTVDDMLFKRVMRTNEIQLIILPWKVSVIHIHDMISIVYSEYGIGGVPIDHMNLCEGITDVTDTEECDNN